MTRLLRTYCTGGDLFGVGAAQAGWRVVDGYEIDPRKAAVARLNGHDVRVADVTRLDMDSLSPCDHEHWSPSCKTASQANSDGGETPEDIAVAQACVRSIHAHAARGGRSWSLENVWGYRNFPHCFPPILAALTEAGFVYDFSHLNMADYGVPQTRKRLIVRAVRGRERGVPLLNPTHRRGGDMFHLPWVGWHTAIEDLLPGLPETQPAPWQAQRLGRLYDPATLSRGYLVGGGNTNMHNPTSMPRPYDEPAFTVRAGGAGSPERAYLLDGSNSSNSGAGVTLRRDDEPAMTLRAGRADTHRALFPGRWVRLNLPCLARFQTVPDSYQGLTAEINGNGVPPLFARRLMETMQEAR